MRALICLFVCLASPLWGAPVSQHVSLKVETKACIQGVLMHPAHVDIGVFEYSKVVELIHLAKEFEDNSNPTDQQSVEKMLSIYSTLQIRVKATPALARFKRIPDSTHVFDIPLVSRVVVFAFGENRG